MQAWNDLQLTGASTSTAGLPGGPPHTQRLTLTHTLTTPASSYTLRLTATDQHGVTTVYSPRLVLCACQNDAVCHNDVLQVRTSGIPMSCYHFVCLFLLSYSVIYVLHVEC